MTKTKNKTRHVAPNPSGGWSSKKGGAKRASRNFSTQQEAITHARNQSRREGSQLIIHEKDRLPQKTGAHVDNQPDLMQLQRDFNFTKVEIRGNVLVGTYPATTTRQDAIRRGRMNGKFYEFVRLHYPPFDSRTNRI